MEDITIKRAFKRDHMELIETLANEIWREAYEGILETEQIEYILRNFRTKEKIYDNIRLGGHLYFISYLNGEPCGYCGIKKDEYERCIYIIDLYVKKEHRRKKICKNILEHVLSEMGEDEFKILSLNVNKNNDDAINAYNAMGFICVNSLKTDIGGGFVSDDYKMVKKI